MVLQQSDLRAVPPAALGAAKCVATLPGAKGGGVPKEHCGDGKARLCGGQLLAAAALQLEAAAQDDAQKHQAQRRPPPPAAHPRRALNPAAGRRRDSGPTLLWTLESTTSSASFGDTVSSSLASTVALDSTVHSQDSSPAPAPAITSALRAPAGPKPNIPLPPHRRKHVSLSVAPPRVITATQL